MFRYLAVSPMSVVWFLLSMTLGIALAHSLPVGGGAIAGLGGISLAEGIFRVLLLLFGVAAAANLLGDYLAFRQAAQGRKWKYVLFVKCLRAGKDVMALSLCGTAIAGCFVYGALVTWSCILWAIAALLCTTARRGVRHLIPAGAAMLYFAVMLSASDSVQVMTWVMAPLAAAAAVTASYLADHLSFRRWQLEFYGYGLS